MNTDYLSLQSAMSVEAFLRKAREDLEGLDASVKCLMKLTEMIIDEFVALMKEFDIRIPKENTAHQEEEIDTADENKTFTVKKEEKFSKSDLGPERQEDNARDIKEKSTTVAEQLPTLNDNNEPPVNTENMQANEQKERKTESLSNSWFGKLLVPWGTFLLDKVVGSQDAKVNAGSIGEQVKLPPSMDVSASTGNCSYKKEIQPDAENNSSANKILESETTASNETDLQSKKDQDIVGANTCNDSQQNADVPKAERFWKKLLEVNQTVKICNSHLENLKMNPESWIKNVYENTSEKFSPLNNSDVQENTTKSGHDSNGDKHQRRFLPFFSFWHREVFCQMYCPKSSELVNKVTEDLVKRLSKRLRKHYKVTLKMQRCHSTKEINNNKPLIVICVQASRLGTDVSNAIKCIQPKSNVAVLILHHTDVHALPTQSSKKILTGPEYTSLDNIFDMGFLSQEGLYKCNMNKTALDDISSFINQCS